jgi:hypothetical protein
MELEEIKVLLSDQGRAFAEFKKSNDERLKTLERYLNAFAKKAGKRGTEAPRRELINNH